MSLLSHVNLDYYRKQFADIADRQVEALELLDKATYIQFARHEPTAEELQAGWVEWWKEWFAAMERGRKRKRAS